MESENTGGRPLVDGIQKYSVTARINYGDYQILKARSKETGATISELIRRAVNEYLGDEFLPRRRIKVGQGYIEYIDWTPDPWTDGMCVWRYCVPNGAASQLQIDPKTVMINRATAWEENESSRKAVKESGKAEDVIMGTIGDKALLDLRKQAVEMEWNTADEDSDEWRTYRIIVDEIESRFGKTDEISETNTNSPNRAQQGGL